MISDTARSIPQWPNLPGATRPNKKSICAQSFRSVNCQLSAGKQQALASVIKHTMASANPPKESNFISIRHKRRAARTGTLVGSLEAIFKDKIGRASLVDGETRLLLYNVQSFCQRESLVGQIAELFPCDLLEVTEALKKAPFTSTPFALATGGLRNGE